MDKILESLKKLLPVEQANEVSHAVDEMLAEARKEIDAEFSQKLEEAYSELSAELSTAEKTAEEGYNEAYSIINELRNRLEIQREEFERQLDEGYEEAYQVILAERAKNSSTEIEVYEEYDVKLKEMKDYIVDKVDQFLQYKGNEIYEQARRDVLNDPRMAERQVALDKIVEIAAGYLSDEDYLLATSSKLSDAYKKLEEMQAQMKMMEARNINLNRQNTKLNENLGRRREQMVTESNNEKKERAQKARQVSGRGHQQVEETVVLAEHNKNSSTKGKAQESTKLLESIGLDRETVNLLAGTKKQK